MADVNWSRGGKYALSGGATGAGIGSFFGPAGTAIGAGVGALGGGLYGLFSDDPGAEPIEQSTLPPEELRQRNLALADLLTGRVAGKAPSPAELQMARGLSREVDSIRSAAMSGAGAVNPALAQRQALYAGQRAMSEFNEDAAILRAQEQAAAESRLAQLLGSQVAIDQNRIDWEQKRALLEQQRDRDIQAGMLETGGELLVANRQGGGGAAASPAAIAPPAPLGGARFNTLEDALGRPTAPWRYKSGSGYRDVYSNPISGYEDGGIVAGPTEALIGEGKYPEAVIPLTSPTDAALAKLMIQKSRQRMAAEERARAMAALALRLSDSDAPRAAQIRAAADAGSDLGRFATAVTDDKARRAAQVKVAADAGARMGKFATMITGAR